MAQGARIGSGLKAAGVQLSPPAAGLWMRMQTAVCDLLPMDVNLLGEAVCKTTQRQGWTTTSSMPSHVHCPFGSQEFGKGSAKVKQYHHYAYKMEEAPPFRICAISAEIPLVTRKAPRSRGADWTHQRIWKDTSQTAYISGLFRRGGEVLMSYGSSDIDARLLTLSVAQLEAMFKAPFDCSGGEVLDPGRQARAAAAAAAAAGKALPAVGSSSSGGGGPTVVAAAAAAGVPAGRAVVGLVEGAPAAAGEPLHHYRHQPHHRTHHRNVRDGRRMQ